MVKVELAALIASGEKFAGSMMINTTLLENGKPVRLEVVIDKPPGDGPFPLLVVNHGSTGEGINPAHCTQTFFQSRVRRDVPQEGRTEDYLAVARGQNRITSPGHRPRGDGRCQPLASQANCKVSSAAKRRCPNARPGESSMKSANMRLTIIIADHRTERPRGVGPRVAPNTRSVPVVLAGWCCCRRTLFRSAP